MNAPTNPRLLVVDDEPDLRTLYELTLLREGYDVESAGSVEEGWSLLQQRGPGGYQLGAFPPGWLEWNDKYRDAVRRYWLTGWRSNV